MSHDKIRIIIVDDHEMVRETWKMILEKDERINVIADCSSGSEAIECANSLQPDVMLMDINMSPMNGFEATRKIMAIRPDIKIIGVSINNQPAYAKNMLQQGAKGYVTKSATKEEMIEAIIQVKNGQIFICKEVKRKMG